MTQTLPRPPAFMPPASAMSARPAFTPAEDALRSAMKATQTVPALLRSLSDPQDIQAALLGAGTGCGVLLTAETLSAVSSLTQKTAQANTAPKPLDWTAEGLVTEAVHAALTAHLPALATLTGMGTLGDLARLMLSAQACALALGAPASPHTQLTVTSLVHAMAAQGPLAAALTRLIGRTVMPVMLTEQAAQVLRTPAPTPAPAPAPTPAPADEFTAGMLPSGFGVNAALIAAMSDVSIPVGYSFDQL